MKGKFIPTNREKYKGIYPIIYRSGWEKQYFQILDTSSKVLWWKSESISIPYYNPIRKKWCRYFPDIVMCIQREGYTEEVVVEIKPHKYTQPPVLPKSGKKTRGYMYGLQEYVINQSKWEKCREYCENRGMSFQILTEETNPEWKWKPKPLKPLKPYRRKR